MATGNDETESDDRIKVPKLLTVRQLSEATGLAQWRIYAMVARGEAPPHMRVGQTLRFPEDGVVHFIREQTQR
jgi:predicted DNA-binding transcriptional regulator AlpA